MDIQTFENEVLKIERLLYHVSWSLLSNQEDCADAVQEALARAWEKRHTLQSRKAFRNWLVQILRNVCNDALRRRSKQRFAPLEEDALQSLTSEPDGYSTIEMLQGLSPEHRLVVVLHYLEGYKIRDIAQMLGVPQGTIKTRLMKARIYLRIALPARADIHGGINDEKK